MGEHDTVVAIVGSRAASRHGAEMAFALGRGLASRGVLVVSGGALGIDAAAHRGALVAGGSTAVVLGCGLDVVYPKQHAELFDDVVARDGALISPFERGTPPRAGCFVTRNRVIAGMADMVIVVEAKSGSGSLHTARAAADFGRVVGAVPGTAGCEMLLAHGAALIESTDDIAAALRGERRRVARAVPAVGTPRRRVLESVGSEPCDAETIAERVGLDHRRVLRELSALEIDGLVVASPGRTYARSASAPEPMAEDSRG